MDRHNYMTLLTGQIRCRRARPMIEEEITGHIDEQKMDFMSQGMTEQEAEEAAVREMGDPVEVGVELDRIHRPKLEVGLLGFIIGLNVLAAAIQVIVLKLAQLCSPGGEIAGQLTLEYVLKHMGAWMVLGVAVMLVICFFDYTLIGKYALWIWAAVLVIMTGYTYMQKQTYWMSSVSGNLFICLMIPVFAAVVYHYRGKGSAGMRKCIALFIITALCSNLCGSGIWYQGIFYIVGAAVIAAAVIKGWFGEGWKRLLLEETIWLIGLPAAAGAVIIASDQAILAPYQQARLERIASPDKEEDAWFTYLSETMSQASREIQRQENSGNTTILFSEEVTESSDIWLSNARSEYVWLFVFRLFGTWQGVVMTVVVFAFLFWLFVLVHRQKNYLGFIIGLSCALMFLLETVLYMAFNFDLLPGGNVYMPFFTYGGINLMVTHLYMGLFLSISRNESLVPIR